ncbi:PREDICTED: transmembrane protein 216 [Corvus brachyrhynchos]|nr:PREDICTED: transmembrane protein 216 [Corvus brachyrhynchos]
MDPRNPLESLCTPQALLGSALAHPSSGEQSLGFWESVGGRHRSSAPLQVLLFLNGWYCATYFLLEAFVFVYKVLLLPYPVSNLVVDVVLLLLYLGIEATRIFFGSKGNLCERKVPLSLSLALTVPAAVLAVYYLLLQTYSLRLEAFLSAILLLFYGLELLLGFLELLSFSSADPY